MELKGRRKFILGLLFILCSTAEVGGVIYAVTTAGASGWEAAGVASLLAAQAGGVFTIVWGNVQEHKANGGQ